MADSKRDFIYAHMNTIYVQGHCKSCGNTETKDTKEYTLCTRCSDAHFKSIRHARESYPTANIRVQL